MLISAQKPVFKDFLLLKQVHQCFFCPFPVITRTEKDLSFACVKLITLNLIDKDCIGILVAHTVCAADLASHVHVIDIVEDGKESFRTRNANLKYLYNLSKKKKRKKRAKL
jgi:hypothetical protein